MIDYKIELNKIIYNLNFIIDNQINDEGLWFEAITAPESYLQQELRKLHYCCESAIKDLREFIEKTEGGKSNKTD